jgi:molybdopterin synthase sulfur carrier subunit
VKYPSIGERIFDDQKQVKKHIVVYINNEDIRFLNKLDTNVKDGDEVIIHPAIAGGCSYRLFSTILV